jgi:hypothetical protein
MNMTAPDVPCFCPVLVTFVFTFLYSDVGDGGRRADRWRDTLHE